MHTVQFIFLHTGAKMSWTENKQTRCCDHDQNMLRKHKTTSKINGLSHQDCMKTKSTILQLSFSNGVSFSNKDKERIKIFYTHHYQ